MQQWENRKCELCCHQSGYVDVIALTVHARFVHVCCGHSYTHVDVHSSIFADVPNPAVSSSLLWEVHEWKENGISEQDILSRLRCRTVPPGHVYTTWKPGMYYAHVHCIVIHVLSYDHRKD